MACVFKVNRIGAQNMSPTYDTILTAGIYSDIANRLFSTTDYSVQYKEERNVGRSLICESGNDIAYLTLSPNGQVRGRNYFFQSVPTALKIYQDIKNDPLNNNKNVRFYYYFLPSNGNNQTSYHNFLYRIMKTMGIVLLNQDYGLNRPFPTGFSTVRDLINERNRVNQTNRGNKSTYITDEGESYHIYGKTFGANQKETTLLCCALSAIAEKPIVLFQIADNTSQFLSKQDVEAIYDYSNSNSFQKIDIKDDSYFFDDDDSDNVNDSLRSPRFVYNLLEKFNGEKKCVLCNCRIDSIVQAAHIYPVAEIRKLTTLTLERRKSLAVDRDNGLWLCENHHKLFDRNLIRFDEGKLCITSRVDKNGIIFVNTISPNKSIDPSVINDRMLAFFDLREKKTPRIQV